MTGGSAHPLWVPYCGQAPTASDWLTRWNCDPLLLVGLALLGFGWHRLAGRDGARWSAAALGVLVLLFVTPFCALTSALFSARVVHHVLLASVVPAMMVLALRRDRLRPRGPLMLWTIVQAVTFWLWHAPSFYAEALSSHFVYWVMQLSLFATALGFWAAIRRASEPAAVAALLVSMVQMGLLGALITFAGAPLYAPHFFTTQAWGLSPLEDQQLAGLIMWAPSAGIYLGAALLIANRWLARESGGFAS